MAAKFPCPCCGNHTLTDQPPGTFQICPVCYWEDDNVQFNDPTFEGGANKESLKQARANFAQIVTAVYASNGRWQRWVATRAQSAKLRTDEKKVVIGESGPSFADDSGSDGPGIWEITTQIRLICG
jgi:hypothetical protein